MSQTEMSEPDQLLLAIDIGNSRTKLGLFRKESEFHAKALECLHSLILKKSGIPCGQHIERWLRSVLDDDRDCVRIEGVLAGTNPKGIQQLKASWPERWPELHQVSNADQVPISLKLKNAKRVGIDRVLNIFAAKQLRTAEKPVIVVDSGTATTVDVLTAEGAFAGGAILPGIEMSAKALNNYTALLPLISIEELEEAQEQPVGQDTRAALRSGLYWGLIGAIRELHKQMLNQLNCSQAESDLIFTGGGGEVLKKQFPNSAWQPHLTLQGIVLVYRDRFGKA